ncbi:hypothetical protein SDC9_130820 [bioreactor metagenome]|uniref:Uncharacterized protein n=1 Tax=bioreactor metagenome TaxID=1076179 RepID=A0A645D3L0_9ZZZZ
MRAKRNMYAPEYQLVPMLGDELAAREIFAKRLLERERHALHTLARADDVYVVYGIQVDAFFTCAWVAVGFKERIAHKQHAALAPKKLFRVCIRIRRTEAGLHYFYDILTALDIAVAC